MISPISKDPVERNGWDNIKRPIRPLEPKEKSTKAEALTGKEETILKGELGPKFAEFK